MWRRKKGKPGGAPDRGRRTHGAKWVFVTPAREMLEYNLVKSAKQPDWVLVKSRKEAVRYLGLLALQDSGKVRKLARQVRIDLLVRNPEGLMVKIGVYTADHVYDEAVFDDTGEVIRWEAVVEDVKGYAEDLFLWKRKHLEVQLGITLRII